MKKLIALIMCLMMLLTMNLLPASAEGMMAGGWNPAEDTAVTEEAQEALTKALDGFVGSSIEPVALLGTQVVAGINYCLLCRVTPVVPNAVPHYALVYVYAGVDGTAQLLEIQDLVLGVSQPE